jgi:hypothetical protein
MIDQHETRAPVGFCSGHTLLKVRGAVCEDGIGQTVTATGEPDTFFSSAGARTRPRQDREAAF